MQHSALRRLRDERTAAPPKRSLEFMRKVMLYLITDVEKNDSGIDWTQTSPYANITPFQSCQDKTYTRLGDKPRPVQLKMEENLLEMFANEIADATRGWSGHASSNPCALPAQDEATQAAAKGHTPINA